MQSSHRLYKATSPRFPLLSFIVIGRLFTASPVASRFGCPDIGVVCHPVHRDSNLDLEAKKAGRIRSRLLQDKDKIKAVALARSRQASSLPAL